MIKRLTTAVLVISISLVLFSSAYPAAGQDDQLSISTNREIIVNDYGNVMINDTITIGNSNSVSNLLREFEITYPSTHLDYNLGYEARFNTVQDAIAARKTVDANSTHLKISPNVAIEIPPQQNVVVRIQLYLGNLVRLDNVTTYLFLAPIFPTMDIPIDAANSTMTLTSLAKLAEPLEGFVKMNIAEREVWKTAPRAIPLDESIAMDCVLHLVAKDKKFTVLEVTQSTRDIELSPSGISAIETLKINNKGSGDISSLKLNLLNNEITSLELLPIEEPPLSSIQQIAIINGIINLEDANMKLAGGDQLHLIFRYPMSKEHVAAIDNTLHINVPIKPVLDTIIHEYVVRITPTQQFHIQADNSEIKITDASPLATKRIEITTRPKVAFASAEVMPVASTVFLVALIFTLWIKGSSEKEGDIKARKNLAEFVQTYDDKILHMRDLIVSLRKEKPLSKKSVENIRREFDEIRSKSASRIGEYKTLLLAARPDLQERILRIAETERGIERLVLDLFANYRQHLTGKAKKEAFDRRESENLAKVDRSIDELSDNLNTLRQEYRD